MTTTSPVVGAPEPPVAPPDPPGHQAEPPQAPAGRRTAATRAGELASRLYAAVQGEVELAVVLVGSFLARWLIADRNSYWNDELLSVNVYARWHDTALDAVRHLAESSIHPPVYQFILYNWMELFGDSERATRSLSNLYITLATLFLYLMLRNVFSRRVALASAVTFALMHTATYYALETRSYAQTIFLVTLSSYLLLRIMRVGADRGWRSAWLSPTGALFTLANAALLLTHYYNVFFWLAQGVIAGVFVLRERSPRGWFAGLGLVAGAYAAQAAIFAAVWGTILIDDYRRRGGAFPAEGGVRSPLDLLRNVVTPNLDPPRVVLWTGLAIAAVMVVRTAITLARSGGLTPERQQAWTVAYLVAWLLLPLVVVYVGFVVTGVARYSTRYWLFIMPPLAPLLVLTIREGLLLADRALARLGGVRIHPVGSALAAAVVVGALVLPGTLAAATETKHDWRGTAQQVVDMVRADPDASYIIYETSHRRRPMANFYFEQFDRDIAVYDTVQRGEERTGQYRILTTDQPIISEHDYLVLIFTHQRTRHFPNVIEQLEDRYEVQHRQLNRSGRGFVVFDVQTPANDSTPDESS